MFSSILKKNQKKNTIKGTQKRKRHTNCSMSSCINIIYKNDCQGSHLFKKRIRKRIQ